MLQMSACSSRYHFRVPLHGAFKDSSALTAKQFAVYSIGLLSLRSEHIPLQLLSVGRAHIGKVLLESPFFFVRLFLLFVQSSGVPPS